MNLRVFNNQTEASFQTALLLVDQITRKPDSVICLASGDSPRLAYELAAVLLRHSRMDGASWTLVGLDEWLGISPENPGSCHFFLRNHVIAPFGLSAGQYRLFNAHAQNPQQECAAMDAFLETRGGIDLMVVGIGLNGHIGFNEPGTPADVYSHVIELDGVTQQVGQKYFTQETPLRQGITLGLRHLLEARAALLIATGDHKAAIIREALTGPVSSSVPASILRKHPNATILLDKAAAARLPVS